MTPDISKVYKTIARHIISPKGQCVLILGPELSINRNGKGYKTIFREIIPPGSKSTYLPSENLFYFNDKVDSDIIKDEVLKFYNEVGDPALLEMISRLPFPLIINVCPDKGLNKVYHQKGIVFREGYFTKNSKTEFNAIPLPSKEQPVIYNIFGSVDLEQSLVLTHSKLYQTIEFLLPTKSLPDNIELFLQGTADSFIFLGFKFDSWYYQLICHKLGIKSSESKTNISTPYFDDTESISVIMKSSFDMSFTSENPSQCIHNILEICEKEVPYCLRKKNPNGAFSTFISYARSDEFNAYRENVVDLIEQNIKSQNKLFQIFRDKSDLNYGDSIDSFMTHIGMGKTVIRIISDKYLKSNYCMIEALRIDKYKDKDKRIFTILMEDADLEDPKPGNDIGKQPTGRADYYKQYWFKRCELSLSQSKLENGGHTEDVAVYNFINNFITEIKDQVHLKLKYSEISTNKAGMLSVDNTRQKDYDRFLNTVINKMKED